MTELRVDKLHNLKRKRTAERAKATRLITIVNGVTHLPPRTPTNNTAQAFKRLLYKLLTSDDSIHTILQNREFDAGTLTCEEYIDGIKRVIQRTTRVLDEILATSTSIFS